MSLRNHRPTISQLQGIQSHALVNSRRSHFQRSGLGAFSHPPAAGCKTRQQEGHFQMEKVSNGVPRSSAGLRPRRPIGMVGIRQLNGKRGRVHGLRKYVIYDRVQRIDTILE